MTSSLLNRYGIGGSHPYLRAWLNTRMRSAGDVYSQAMMDRANRDNAPDDTVYFFHAQRRWVGIDEVATALRKELEEVMGIS